MSNLVVVVVVSPFTSQHSQAPLTFIFAELSRLPEVCPVRDVCIWRESLRGSECPTGHSGQPWTVDSQPGQLRPLQPAEDARQQRRRIRRVRAGRDVAQPGDGAAPAIQHVRTADGHGGGLPGESQSVGNLSFTRQSQLMILMLFIATNVWPGVGPAGSCHGADSDQFESLSPCRGGRRSSRGRRRSWPGGRRSWRRRPTTWGPTTGPHCPASCRANPASTKISTWTFLSSSRRLSRGSTISGYVRAGSEDWQMLQFQFSVHTGLYLANLFGTLCSLFGGLDDGGAFGVSLAYVIFFVPLSFLCWFRPAYKAFKADSSMWFMTFFLVFFGQFCFSVLMALGIRQMGAWWEKLQYFVILWHRLVCSVGWLSQSPPSPEAQGTDPEQLEEITSSASSSSSSPRAGSSPPSLTSSYWRRSTATTEPRGPASPRLRRSSRPTCSVTRPSGMRRPPRPRPGSDKAFRWVELRPGDREAATSHSLDILISQ